MEGIRPTSEAGGSQGRSFYQLWELILIGARKMFLDVEVSRRGEVMLAFISNHLAIAVLESSNTACLPLLQIDEHGTVSRLEIGEVEGNLSRR